MLLKRMLKVGNAHSCFCLGNTTAAICQRLLGLVVLGLLCVGCGQKGPLTLPESPANTAEEAAEEPRTSQQL